MLLADIAGGHLACGGDTSSCVSTRHKTTVYRGSLPFASKRFEVNFPSVSQAGGGLVGGFRTDNSGRYCIVWAPEGGTFVIGGSENYGYFIVGQPLNGPPPPGCQSGNKNVPWWRADDLQAACSTSRSSPQRCWRWQSWSSALDTDRQDGNTSTRQRLGDSLLPARSSLSSYGGPP